MIKIKSLYLSSSLAFFVVAASAGIFLFKGGFSFAAAVVYALLLALSPYAINDARMGKKEAASLVFLALSLLSIAAGQFVFSFYNGQILWAGACFMAAGLLFIIVRAAKASPAPSEKKNDKTNAGLELAALTLILALALFLRLYKSGSIPPGVWYDEAQNGLESLAIAKGTPLQVFIPRMTMMPAMFFYIASFFTSLLGPGIFSLRLVSVAAGVLSVAAFYFFARAALKDVKLALAGAAMLAMSSWHITFSRVAFLGMLTLLLEVVCFYFYFKAMSRRSLLLSVIAGAAMGLSLYTFSGADFIPIVIALHCLYLVFRRGKELAAKDRRNMAAIFMTAAVVAAPLLIYAVENTGLFTKRIQDVSIMNEIKAQKSLVPVINSVKTHLLMFNYEGDYNGRHNLYKKPMLDFVAGGLLAAGLFIAVADTAYVFYLIWFLVMLGAGVTTISIEAPQAYRIIAIVPCVYMLALVALKEILRGLKAVNPSKIFSWILIGTVVLCAGALDIHRYFVLYPADKATYLSFSPEANAIAGFIGENRGDYAIYTSEGSNLYGFFPWEQKVICDFINYGKDGYIYMTADNFVDKAALSGKKGIIAVLRNNDRDEEAAINREYPAAGKKEFRNRVTDEVMFVCYYIDASMLKNKTDDSKPMIFYTR
jgi:4-amino-4-deoxy-L-arabinose transferase-like glycosyltransferase